MQGDGPTYIALSQPAFTLKPWQDDRARTLIILATATDLHGCGSRF
jgi:hypothetical protein